MSRPLPRDEEFASMVCCAWVCARNHFARVFGRAGGSAHSRQYADPLASLAKCPWSLRLSRV
eukprot:7281127-Pyramimonas_sp.AAC.1